MEMKLLNLNGTEEGKQELPEFLFSKKADIHFLHEAVKYYLANKRKGCSSTKTRAEVHGGGKKPWKQKGTGRARQGTIRSPLWRGGGVVFGPKPKSWRQNMPQTKRRSALLQALSVKYADGAMFAVKELKLEEAKTKNLRAFIKALEAKKNAKILFLDEKIDEKFSMAAQNIKNISWAPARALNAYDVLRADRIVFTPKAIEILLDCLKED